MQVGIARQGLQAPAQCLFPFRIAPELAPGIGKIDIGAGKALVERDGTLERRDRLVAASLLQAQIAALARPSMARLLTFLPALYVNFWGVVRPDELALLVGELEIPAIPSPYLEPSADTLLALKKQLKALPDTDRSTLLSFCRALPHKLTLRPEMREFFPD